MAKLAEKLGHKPTRKEIVREAVMRDFKFIRGWCNDEWTYVGIIVKHEDSGKSESIWGVESDAYEYHDELAHELADQIAFELDAVMAVAIETSRPDMQPGFRP